MVSGLVIQAEIMIFTVVATIVFILYIWLGSRLVKMNKEKV